MRSKLFVPGARPDFFEKALRGDADALSFDLEDSVPEDGKSAARDRLAELLDTSALRDLSKTIIVRVNAFGTPHFDADVAALAGAHLHFVNLPKTEDVKIVGTAADQIVRACPDVRLIVNIETPRGLAHAGDIADSGGLVVGLQVGLNDLFEPLGIARTDPWNVRAVLWQVRLAAAQADVFAFDGAWPWFDDDDGFRREAVMARSMGYLGKSCIHPRQVAIANAVFDRALDVVEAQRIVDKARAAASKGAGAFRLDGKMIDAPAIAQAEAVLASSRNAK